MIVDRNTIVFFDASCLIAAAGSPAGGSGFLLSLCERKLLKAAVSLPVLLEAQRNIQEKLPDEALISFYNILANVPFLFSAVPAQSELKRLETIINQKDTHVVAAASDIHSEFLITLDRGLIVQVNGASLKLQALTPGEFIKKILPSHKAIR